MYLLYLDDSGSANNPAENNLVIGGLAVFERDIRWFVTQMDNLAKEIDPDSHRNIEFHASEIFSRRKAPWNRMTKDEAIKSSGSAISATCLSISILSDDTVACNIAFGVPEAKIDWPALEEAAKVANSHDFIVNELPEGYDTLVGERGIRLSAE